ncbi:MAG: LysR family transcriptional regulator [Alphaproteobacteria bacterium]|nr:LysR family transcriptional regulator [Alphaproteobacteria bacterium]
MPLAQLRYFNEVVRTGSIREAAERLNVAPSAISRQIRNLEEEFGLPLFERHARGVVPTSAGELYARYARAALLDQERIQSEIDDLKGLRRGHVRISSVEGVVANGLTHALAAFRQRFAGVSFSLSIMGAEMVVAAVRNGETDIGISFTSNPEPGVRYAARIRDPLCAIMAPDYPLARHRRIAFGDTLAYPLAVPPKSFGIRTLLDARCRSARLAMHPALETNSIEAMRGFARTGSGITFLPRLTVRREIREGLAVAVPLTNRDLQQATVDLCVLEGRRLPGAVEGFLNHLRQVLPTLR